MAVILQCDLSMYCIVGWPTRLSPRLGRMDCPLLSYVNRYMTCACAKRPMQSSALPSVPEERVVGTRAVGSHADEMVLARRRQGNQLAPWQSPAVHELVQRAGNVHDATPMVIEGPTGTVMAAIGEQRDNQIASRALAETMQGGLQEKLQRAEREKRMLQHNVRTAQQRGEQPIGAGRATADRRIAPVDPSPAPRTGARGGAVALSTGSGPLAAGQGPTFGAVYEYRDSVGKPHYVAGTSSVPEAAFAEDYRTNAGVRQLFDGPESAHGRAKVVWVGVGGGACGHAEMASARQAVAKERSERQRICELSGAKPYSRHSHMLT